MSPADATGGYTVKNEVAQNILVQGQYMAMKRIEDELPHRVRADVCHLISTTLTKTSRKIAAAVILFMPVYIFLRTGSMTRGEIRHDHPHTT